MSRQYSKKMSSFHDEEVVDAFRDSSTMTNVEPRADEDTFNRQYDLTPVAAKVTKRKSRRQKKEMKHGEHLTSPSRHAEPWETVSPQQKERKSGEIFFPHTFSNESDSEEHNDGQYPMEDEYDSHEDDHSDGQNYDINTSVRSTFLMPSDIHPRMEEREDDIAQLRLLAGKLNADWGGQDFMAPALARRIRDFQFAQEKRRKKYGDERPWGILGLYDHLASIRIDVEWAEDAAWRRANGEPYLSWADFDASKKRGINRPFFTYFLLFTCTVALIVSIALNGWKVEPLDVNPMIGPSADTLIQVGAKQSYLIVYNKQVWRLLSSAILHAGLVHYFVNSLALWFVGTAIETTHGTVAAAILFIVPAVGGTILSAIFLPEYITVGASGGIFGLIGACLSDIIMNWKHLFSDFVTEDGKRGRHVLVVVCLFFDIALNCLIGLTPFVDNFTHLGGMVFGLLCGLSTMERLPSDFFGMEENCFARTKHVVVRLLGLIVSIILIIITAVILMEGDGETAPCPNCQWLSCVPFPPWKSEKWWYCDDCGRVTAEIIESPTLHLQLDCPGGASVAVGIETDQVDRNKLEAELPNYCREFCPDSTS
ncbi:rhomboid family protein [Nitzschia inconspicua]|uniref:rhomboid protease n=1 Tax=Nitzschia inconspicua TaxID=303405 RepID=A0A9K3KWI6_9STRA|nr:rhomboid family protein [Nitzschia inconspicua]